MRGFLDFFPKRPLAWSGLFFSLGLSGLLTEALPIPDKAPIALVAAVAGLLVRRMQTYFLAAAALLAGWSANAEIARRQAPPVLRDLSPTDFPLLRVVGTIEERGLSLEENDSERYVARWESLHTPSGQVPVEGRFRLFLTEPGHSFLPGDRIEAFGRWKTPSSPTNPHEKDRARAEFRREIWGTLECAPGCARRLDRPSWSARAWIARFRLAALDGLQRRFSKEQAEIAGPLLLGVWPRDSQETIDLFQRTGAIHLLAVSGMHVTLLFGSVAAVALRRAKRRGVVLALLGLCLFLYSGLTGFQPPSIRASLMLWLANYAWLLRRPADSASALGASAWIVCALFPAEAENASFQLSFGATAGIALFGAAIQNALVAWIPSTMPLRSLASRILRGVAISCAAFSSSLPILVRHFHLIPTGSIPATLLAAPFLVPLMFCGYAALLAPPWIASGAATGFAFLQHGVLLPLQGVDALLGSPIPTGNFPWILVVALGLGSLLLWKPGARRAGALLLILGATGAMWRSFALVQQASPPLRLDILDAGHGNAIIIRTPEGQCVLFDAGSSSRRDFGRSVLLPFLHGENIRIVDLLVISHADADHWNALPSLFGRIPVRKIVVGTGVREKIAPFLRSTALDEILEARGPMRWQSGRTEFEIWRAAPEKTLTSNDGSLSLLVRSHERRALLCGDLEEEGIRAMLEADIDWQSEILLLPHHGLPAEGLSELIERVDPQWAIASCGGRFPGEGLAPEGWEERFLSTKDSGAIRLEIENEPP